jgi:dipeptidyl aminopeptidase/acylaminoacyl peptidase
MGTCDLFLQRLGADGPDGQPRRMTELPGTVAVPAFTRDGRWIAFHRVINGERDVWIIPATGGTPVNLTNRPGMDAFPAFSPDGSRMAFVSDRLGGQHLWVVGYANGRLTGTPRQLTSGDGSEVSPSWSPDGRRMLVVRQGGNDSDACVLDLDGGGPPRAVTHGVPVEYAVWGPKADSVMVAAFWDKLRLEVRNVRLQDGAVEREEPPLVLATTNYDPTFDVSADGRIVAFASTSISGDIWIADGLDGRR